MFINYKEDIGFTATIMYETKDGVVPVVIKNPNFINYYPYIAKKLMEGKILYINHNHGYIGIEITDGPYGEEKSFISEYESNNINFLELINNLEHNIKQDKKRYKKLVKIGMKYKNLNTN